MTKYLNEIISKSTEETFNLGFQLGKSARIGDIFALTGELGTGKTILTKGIAKGLGIDEEITSPTFTLLEIYPAETPFYHFDLYRIESQAELDHLGFEEYWEGDGVSVIEWADKAGELSGNIIKIKIEYLDEKRRRIIIEYPDDRHVN